MKKLLVYITFTFLCLNLFAQNDIKFNGKILSSVGFVYNANVVKKSTYIGTVSDIDGNFSLMVSNNDTISFTCIGYKKFTYIIPDTLKEKNFRVILTMVEDTVSIKEAVITPWPINRTLLKQAFLDEEKVEKEKIASYAGFVELESDPKEPEPTILNPVSFIANIFSRKRIQQKKMNRIRRKLQEE